MKYAAQRFDSVYYLKDFLNANKIPQKNIVGIFRKDNGFMELLYIESQTESEELRKALEIIDKYREESEGKE